MGDQTAIEWTEKTFNPWWGCSRVSPACRFCYADRDASRWGNDLWRRNGPRKPMSEDYWRKPLSWNRKAELVGVPVKVFCASMADVFEDHPQVRPWRDRLWPLIEATPWLTWQLLTKRIENVAGMVPWTGQWPRNVWIGTSVETQRFADQRIPDLLGLGGAAVRFLSCEPLLGPLDLSAWLPRPFERQQGGYWLYGPGCDVHGNGKQWVPGPSIGWVIGGGESGPKARPSQPAWFQDLRDQCVQANVPYLFKQWGEWAPTGQRGIGNLDPREQLVGDPDDRGFRTVIRRVGKKAAGRELDGRFWDEYPQTLAPSA